MGERFLCLLVHFTSAPAWLSCFLNLGHSFCCIPLLCYLILLIIHLLLERHLTITIFIFHPVLHPSFCCYHAQEVVLLLLCFCGFCLCYRVCHTPLSFLSHAALCTHSPEEFSVNKCREVVEKREVGLFLEPSRPQQGVLPYSQRYL